MTAPTTTPAVAPTVTEEPTIDPLVQADVEKEARRKALRKAARLARKERGSNGNGGNGKVATDPTNRVAKVKERDLLAWADDLKLIQAAIEQGQATQDGADVLARIAKSLVATVNPLKARLVEFEQGLSDLNIALAEAQLALAKAEAIHTAARRTTRNAESPEALAAGKVVAEAAQEVDRLTVDRNAVRANYFLAAR